MSDFCRFVWTENGHVIHLAYEGEPRTFCGRLVFGEASADEVVYKGIGQTCRRCTREPLNFG